MGTTVNRIIAAVVATFMVLAGPSAVLAHGLVGRLQSPLPLGVYVAGAAIAVAISFVIVMARDVRMGRVEPGPIRVVPRPIVLTLRILGLVAWSWILLQAAIGGTSAAAVGPLFLWVYGWVGMALVSAFIGPVWTWIDPFATLYDLGAWIVRRLGVRPWAPIAYPSGLLQWPAVGGLIFFVWLELVAQTLPLAIVLVAYTAVTLLAMMQFGKDRWRTDGETFSVWFGLLGRLAPFALAPGHADRAVIRRPFASGLSASWNVPLVALASIGTASIIFDGLSQTEVYFRLVGLPSLPAATVILLGFLAIVVGLVLLAARSVGLAAVGAGILPIAIGYLIAHYLTFIIGDGQGIVIAISDPLQLGWDLFGTAFYEPSLDWIPPVVLWTVMLGAVVGGHVIGAWAGHAAPSEGLPAKSHGRQWPLAVLMVGLTTLTLWSLGQVVVEEIPVAVASQVAHQAPMEAGRRPDPRCGSSRWWHQ